MNESDARRALLGRLWDYAGVFPPAELPLDDALAEWRRIRASNDAWLVNRLVVRPGHVEACGSEPLAIVDGTEERHGDVVFREGETKLRCGGSRVPGVSEVADFIRSCRTRGAVFKATAGLHHAVRAGGQHGFLNLLAASCLGFEEAVLADDDPSAFRLTPERFSWRGQGCDGAKVAEVRRGLFTSFGSCSVQEPVEELQKLEIL